MRCHGRTRLLLATFGCALLAVALWALTRADAPPPSPANAEVIGVWIRRVDVLARASRDKPRSQVPGAIEYIQDRVPEGHRFVANVYQIQGDGTFHWGVAAMDQEGVRIIGRASSDFSGTWRLSGKSVTMTVTAPELPRVREKQFRADWSGEGLSFPSGLHERVGADDAKVLFD